jgi:hypothetical protein
LLKEQDLTMSTKKTEAIQGQFNIEWWHLIRKKNHFKRGRSRKDKKKLKATLVTLKKSKTSP